MTCSPLSLSYNIYTHTHIYLCVAFSFPYSNLCTNIIMLGLFPLDIKKEGGEQ